MVVYLHAPAETTVVWGETGCGCKVVVMVPAEELGGREVLKVPGGTLSFVGSCGYCSSGASES